MIHSLLQIPDSPNARRYKDPSEYPYGLYYRDRVLAVAHSTEAGPPNGNGRRCVATRPTRAGRHGSGHRPFTSPAGSSAEGRANLIDQQETGLRDRVDMSFIAGRWVILSVP
jgi:hypothetical protein